MVWEPFGQSGLIDSSIVWEHSAWGAGAAGRDVGETESL